MRYWQSPRHLGFYGHSFIASDGVKGMQQQLRIVDLTPVRQLTTARLIDTIVSQTDDKRSFLPERPREDIVHLITNTPSVYLHHALSDLQTAWLLDIRQSTITHFQSIRNQVVMALGNWGWDLDRRSNSVAPIGWWVICPLA